MVYTRVIPAAPHVHSTAYWFSLRAFRGMRVKRVRCVCALAFSSEDSGSRKWYSNAIYCQRCPCLMSAHQPVPVGLSRDKINLCGHEVEVGWKVL